MKKMLTTYLSVFEGRLYKIKNDIKHEISKPKKERSKDFLKTLLVESKQLRDLVNEMKEESRPTCPHCGEII